MPARLCAGLEGRKPAGAKAPWPSDCEMNAMTEAAPLPAGWPVMSKDAAHALLTAKGTTARMEVRTGYLNVLASVSRKPEAATAGAS